jgi:predicted nucleic acid-binding protein
MATDGRSPAIIETSVLVNFLVIDRTDLLAQHPHYRFIVLDVVRAEVLKRNQLARLEAALLAGDLVADGPPEATSLDELAIFAAMASLKLGLGEKAAIAAAKARGLALAMDDRRAWNRAAAFCAGVPREDTVSLVVALLKAGTLDVAEADAIKEDWERNHRYAKKDFASFGELLS